MTTSMTFGLFTAGPGSGASRRKGRFQLPSVVNLRSNRVVGLQPKRREAEHTECLISEPKQGVTGVVAVD